MEVFVAKVCLLRSNGKSAADIPSKRRGAEKSGLAIIPKVHCGNKERFRFERETESKMGRQAYKCRRAVRVGVR